jgi:starch phosphorylase
MEIALDPAIPTYSGGLGMLAGDTLRSAADMGLPVTAVTLLHRRGYFKQRLGHDGAQSEEDVTWNPSEMLDEMEKRIAITVQNRIVMVRAWRYEVKGVNGHVVPVYLLDTDVEPNDHWDRKLTDLLYGGDNYYRLCQETILGLGGIRMLEALGHEIDVHHMNEGHASLLALGLLEERLTGASIAEASDEDIEQVRASCVFTTHTPVPAGHDKFGIDFTLQVLGSDRTALLQRLGCCPDNCLNMTTLALRFSRYVNGVAVQHGRVSRSMFPEHDVRSITNGVHAATWASTPFLQMFDEHFPGWRGDNNFLHNMITVPAEQVRARHAEAKKRLVHEVVTRTGTQLSEECFTIGFARRVATYKRADLLFQSPERLAEIAKKFGGLQILFAGKSHPADHGGKQLIRNIFDAARRLNCDTLKILYLENYDWELGARLTSGVDLWLNTPLRPHEASGTSGMKAALNGVPSLSTLDGWWVEGCVEGVTGWAIADADSPEAEAASLYDKLENAVLPLYHANGEGWAQVMRSTIALNGSFFNTHRMLSQYATNAYYPAELAAQRAESAQAVSANRK